MTNRTKATNKKKHKIKNRYKLKISKKEKKKKEKKKKKKKRMHTKQHTQDGPLVRHEVLRVGTRCLGQVLQTRANAECMAARRHTVYVIATGRTLLLRHQLLFHRDRLLGRLLLLLQK
jgi:hypothetical protein